VTPGEFPQHRHSVFKNICVMSVNLKVPTICMHFNVFRSFYLLMINTTSKPRDFLFLQIDDYNQKFGLFTFQSGYRTIHLNSTNGYSRKEISSQYTKHYFHKCFTFDNRSCCVTETNKYNFEIIYYNILVNFRKQYKMYWLSLSQTALSGV